MKIKFIVLFSLFTLFFITELNKEENEVIYENQNSESLNLQNNYLQNNYNNVINLDNSKKELDEQNIVKSIRYYEKSLVDNNTSVLKELNKMIQKYQGELNKLEKDLKNNSTQIENLNEFTATDVRMSSYLSSKE